MQNETYVSLSETLKHWNIRREFRFSI